MKRTSGTATSARCTSGGRGDRRGEGNALGNLGSAYYALGEARRAIEFYEQARSCITHSSFSERALDRIG